MSEATVAPPTESAERSRRRQPWVKLSAKSNSARLSKHWGYRWWSDLKSETWRDILLRKVKEASSNIVMLEDQRGFVDDPLFAGSLGSLGTLCRCDTDLEIFKAVNVARNESSKLFIVSNTKKSVPYEVERKSARVALTPSIIFPLLDPGALSEFGLGIYDKLFDDYQHEELYTRISARKTIELILHAVFELDLNRIDLESAVGFFARLYLKRYGISYALAEDVRRKADELCASKGIDIFKVSFSENDFWDWLSGQWNAYVAGSPSLVDFSHIALSTVLPSFFSFGALKRISISDLQSIRKIVEARPLALIGLEFHVEDQHDIVSAIQTKLTLIADLVAQSNRFDHELWLNAAEQWGQVMYLVSLKSFSDRLGEIGVQIDKLRSQTEKEFQRYLLKEYDNIMIASTNQNPQTVDRILHHIWTQIRPHEKAALVVFDGMGMAEWEIVREYFAINSIFVKSEKQVFAMLPTLTTYSREAIFSGKQPNEFMGKIKGLREKSSFTEFWTSKGLNEDDVFFDHVVPDKGMMKHPKSKLVEVVSAGVKILGLVFNFIDMRLHGPYDLDVGKRLFHLSVRNFLQESCLADIFRLLIEKGYRIYITSDHGNILAIGNGVFEKRGLAETQGKRCFVFDSKLLAEDLQKKTDCLMFDSRFLATDSYVLFANGGYFFGQSGSREITHGGVSLEESVVPFAEV